MSDVNVFEHEQLGPFYVTIQDHWHPNTREDCIVLHLADGDFDAVPREYFPIDTPITSVWQRAVELTEGKINKWRRELAEFRSLHGQQPITVEAAIATLTYDDLGAMLTAAGIVPHESLPGRITQLCARLS